MAFLGTVKEAANFEQAMANVQAVMSPSEANQFGAALDDLALSLGASTSFNALQVAGGIKEMLKAGFNAEDVLGGVAQAVLNLASATDTGVTESATLAAQSLAAFGLSAKSLPSVVNTLAGVSVTTAADMHDMSQALSDAGGTASAAGLSFEEFATAIGIFRQHGVSANASGTALKTMLTRLVPNTKAEVSAFNQLGLTVDGANNAFFDAQGHFLGMANASQQLKRALGGMNEQQRIAFITTAFGTEAIQGINVLIDEGADGFNKYAASIGQISATELAARRINTLLGSIEALGGALQTASIKIGQFFTPAIRAVTVIVQGVVQTFLALSPAAQGMVTAFVGISAALAGLIGGFVLVVSAVQFFGPSFLAIGRILLSLVPVFGAVALVAGVLAAAWATNLFGIREKVQAAFDAIPGILNAVSGAFSAAGRFWETAIVPAVFTIANAIEQRILPVFNNLSNRIGPLLSHFGVLIKKAFSGDVGGAVNSFITIIGTLFPAIRGPLIAISTAIGNFVAIAGPVLGILGQVFERVFAGNISGALSLFRDLMVDLIPILGPVLDILGNIANSVGPVVATTFESLAKAVGGFAAGAGAGLSAFFTQTLPPILEVIGGVAGDVGQGLLTFFNTVVAPVAQHALAFAGDIGSGLRVFFTETLPPILETIGGFAGEVGADLLAFFSEKLPIVRDAAAAFGGDVGAGLTTFFTATLPQILTSVQNFAGDVGASFIAFFREHIPAVADVLERFGSNPGVAFLSFFRDDIPTVIASAQRFTADVTAQIVDFFQNKAPVILAGLATFTPETAKPFLSFFQNFDEIKTQVESLQPLFTAIGEFGTSLVRLSGAILALEGRTIAPVFEALRGGVQQLIDVSGAAPAIDTLGTSLETLGTKLSGVTQFFKDAAEQITAFAEAVDKIKGPTPGTEGTPEVPAQSPGFDIGGGRLQIPGQTPGQPFDLKGFLGGQLQGDNGLFKKTSFGGGEGPLVQIGQIFIGSEAEMQAFLAQMADTIRAAAGRVNAPPDNSGNPQLAAALVSA